MQRCRLGCGSVVAVMTHFFWGMLNTITRINIACIICMNVQQFNT